MNALTMSSPPGVALLERPDRTAVAMLPVDALAHPATDRNPIVGSPDAAICSRNGAVDWLCGACGFVIFSGLKHPERLRSLTVRCPGCDAHQRSGA